MGVGDGDGCGDGPSNGGDCDDSALCDDDAGYDDVDMATNLMYGVGDGDVTCGC